MRGRRFWGWLGLILWSIGPGDAAHVRAQSPVAWLGGPGLRRQLDTVLPGVYRADASLRHVVRSLCEQTRVAALIDRRVDLDQPITVELADQRAEEIFRGVARAAGQEICLVGSVIYVGPTEAVSRARTLSALRHEEARRLPPQAGRRLLAVERMGWPDFATPGKLLAEQAGAGGFEIAGMSQVPHDLWAAADLPPLSLIDRITLIAIQLDLTFQADPEGGRLTLVPIPEDVAVVKEYAGGLEPERLAEKWASLLPHGDVRVSQGKIVVRGSVEDHEKITASRRPSAIGSAKAPAGKPPQPRFTVTGRKGPAGRLLDELAAKLQLELRIDEAALQRAGISLNDQVAFSVKDATIDEVLEAVLAPAGCTFRREGKVVEVFPAQVPNR